MFGRMALQEAGEINMPDGKDILTGLIDRTQQALMVTAMKVVTKQTENDTGYIVFLNPFVVDPTS